STSSAHTTCLKPRARSPPFDRCGLNKSVSPWVVPWDRTAAPRANRVRPTGGTGKRTTPRLAQTPKASSLARSLAPDLSDASLAPRRFRQPTFLDDLDQFVEAVAVVAGEVDELFGSLDDSATFGCAGFASPSAMARRISAATCSYSWLSSAFSG